MDKARRIVRVRPPELGGTCAVLHPDTGQHVVPAPGEIYYADDPLVRAHPWLFVADARLEVDGIPGPVTAVETTEARPRRGRR